MKLLCSAGTDWNELNSRSHGSALQREWWELTKVMHICQLISFLFKCLECFLLPIREKLLKESQPDIAFMARSKQEIYKPYSDVSECIGINCCSLPVPALNQIESNKARLVIWCYRDITATTVSCESIMTLFNWTVFKRNLYISEHFCVSFPMVTVKLIFFAVFLGYKVCRTIKICQISWLIWA